MESRFQTRATGFRLQESASLQPIQSPPQHEKQSRSVGQIRQGVVSNAFLTTRYCGCWLWKTGIGESLNELNWLAGFPEKRSK
jgi:hypothetical protein